MVLAMARRRRRARLDCTIAERGIAHQLAARTGADWRTALRALREGPDAIRTLYLREKLARAIAAMGMTATEPHRAA
jgi:hypothetical protein